MGSMKISFDYNNAMSCVVGDKHGIQDKELKELNKLAAEAHQEIQRQRNEKLTGIFDLPYDTLLVQAIMAIGNEIRRSFENFVVIGTGGASLGPRCLCQALTASYHNFLPAAERKHTPRIFFLNNPDPDEVKGLLDALDLRNTAFNIISKSGDTMETLSIFMHVYNVVQRRFSKGALSKHFIITTGSEKGLIRDVAVADKLKTLSIPENVNERFSVFSPVGLLPAAVADINIKDLLSGAIAMDKQCSKYELSGNPAYMSGAIHYLAHTKKGKNISVMMPYSSALEAVGEWYKLVCAESLARKSNAKGNHSGQTSMTAVGSAVHHSLMPLFLQGPNDKIFTFLELKKFEKECAVPRVFPAIEALNHLTEQDLSVLLNNELLAAEYILARHERPSVKLSLGEINALNIGALLYFLELQTAFSSCLYHVNGFEESQAGEVETLTHALLGMKTPECKELLKSFKAETKEKKKHKCL
jgi:glucose-6-phosphate isomerase